MHANRLVIILIISCFILPLGSNTVESQQLIWWDEDWSYRQEISIPIDTGNEHAKYQSIDTRIKFENPCWAESEKEHSVRIIYQERNIKIELESQIYDLKKTSNDIISECSLVFLIPKEATGNEKYFVYYDEDEKSGPNYQDHVKIEETYYRYEPIPGYPCYSYYYKVIDEGYNVYAIAFKGEIMGIRTNQQVVKFKSKSEKFIPCNGETLAFFDFWYYYNEDFDGYESTCNKFISKDILVDGNIMVSFNLVSSTNKDEIKTEVLYKYYFCPEDDKKLYAHIEHEVLKEGIIETYDFYDGSYVSLQSGGLKSSTMEELNFGEIYPFIHIHSEDNTVKEFSLYKDPEYSNGEWNIPILRSFDDVDLGSQSWACYDKGVDGQAHSLILSSNNVVKSGIDERDGVQVQIYETGYPELPGLENNVASFQLGRNSFEIGETHDKKIPKGFKVEFDVDFYSTETGGYEKVAEESNIFKELVKIRPGHIKKDKSDEEDKPKFTLKTYVHLAPSFPIGSVFSTLTGKDFSFITGEIYKDGDLIQSNIANRISFFQLPEIEDKKIIEKIKLLAGVFDFKNLTFFKKVIFPDLQSGEYIVKIYKNNPLFSDEKKFIGYQMINLTNDKTSHIVCTSEVKMSVSVYDQFRNVVENVKIQILDKKGVISEAITNENGQCYISAPSNIFEKYSLKMFYKGFLIHNENIKLSLLKSISIIKKTKEIELYDLKIKLLDIWNFPLQVKLAPYINSEGMNKINNILSEQNKNSEYIFTNLIPEIYNLNIEYKSVKLNDKITISSDRVKTIVFPLEYNIKTKALNNRGFPLNNVRVEFLRKNKKETFKIMEEGTLIINLPPGIYLTKIYENNDLIGKRKVTILDDITLSLLTNNESSLTLIITILGVLFLFVSFLIFTKKNQFYLFLKFSVIIIFLVSIMYPWWNQIGTISNITTSSTLYIKPVELVSFISTPDVIGGNIASLPDIFIFAIDLVSILTIIGCITIVFAILFERFQKNKFYLLSMFSSIILFFVSFMIFIVAMSELTNITVDGFIGRGEVEISIIGESSSIIVPSSWGPHVGFYLYLLAILMLSLQFLLVVLKLRKKKKEK